MHLRSLAASLCLLAVPLAAQDMPKPGKEHLRLARIAGTYDSVIESQGGGQTSTSKGEVASKMDFGGFWLVEEFKADFGGMDFKGHAMTTFDTFKGKYVQTWIDSMAPVLLVLEGDFDKDGKVLTMTGKAAGPDGKPVTYRNVTTWKDDNSYTLEMNIVGEDGKSAGTMKVSYTRRAGKAAETAAPKKAEPKKGDPAPKK